MLRGAIIGFGYAGQNHAEAYKNIQDIRITAIADISNQRLTVAKEKLGVQTKSLYTDYKKMLTEEKLDFIDICVPHSYHKEIVISAAKKGLHILCEKPLGLSLAEIDEMIQAVKENDLQLMVCHELAYLPSNSITKRLIDDGKIGRVFYIECKEFWSSYSTRAVPEYRPSWRSEFELSGGGPLIDQGLHSCYLSKWFLGSEVNSVTAVIDNLNRPEYSVEDFAYASFRFQNGSIADIRNSWCVTKEEQFRKIEGEKATLLVGEPIVLFFRDETHQIQAYSQGKGSIIGYEGLIKDFLSAIKGEGKTKYPVTAQDGRDAVGMVLAAYESGALGREVVMPLKPSDPIYQKGVRGLRDIELSKESPIYKKNIFNVREYLREKNKE